MPLFCTHTQNTYGSRFLHALYWHSALCELNDTLLQSPLINVYIRELESVSWLYD